MADKQVYNRSLVELATGANFPLLLHDNGDGTFSFTFYSGGGTAPTGSATSAKQDTGNTSLATIATNTGAATPAGENHIGEVGGRTVLASASAMTRPADTNVYASGDLVANSTTAGSVAPLQFTVARVAAGSGMIRRVRLRKSGTSVTTASFRLHLYTASPTVTNGDNGVWLSDNAANYLGALDVTVDRAFSDGAAGNGVPVSGSEINFALASGQIIYGLLEARSAYTPANAEVFTLSLEVLQN